MAVGVSWIPILLLFGGAWFFPLGVPPLPENPALLKAVPQECLLLLESRGVSEADPASKNEIERLLAEPEVKEFIEVITNTLEGAARQAMKGGGAVLAQELPRLVRILLTRPMVLYLGPLKINVGSPPDISGGIVLDAGTQAAEVERSIRALIQVAGLEGGAPVETVAGADIHTLPLPPDAPPIAWGKQENRIFLGVGTGTAAAIARRLAGEAPGGIPQNIAKLRTNLRIERPGLLTHIDVAGILEAFPPELQGQFRPILDALGLNSVGTIAQVSGLEGRGFTSKTLVTTHGDLRGLLAPFRSRPLEKSALQAVPADATVAIAGRLDTELIYREILDTIGRIDPQAREEATRGILDAESELGFRLSEDLFQALGDTWRLYNSPGEGGLLVTGLTLVVDVRDEDRIQRTLDRFASLLTEALARGRPEQGIPPRTIRFQGKTIYTMDLSASARRGDFIPLAPSWCFTEGKLVISLFPQMVKAHLSRKEAAQGETPARTGSLADLPEVAELWSEGRAPIAVSWADTRAFFRILYPFVPFLAEMASAELRREGINISSALLPSAPAIEPHLIPAVSAGYRTEEGILLVQKGGMPLAGGLAPLAMPLFLGLTTTRTYRSDHVATIQRDEAMVAQADAMDRQEEANLRMLSQALQLYQVEHGKYPPDLEALIKEDYLKNFPQVGRYIYFGSGSQNLPPDAVLVASRLIKNGRHQVVLVNGQVQSMSREEYRAKTSGRSGIQKKKATPSRR